MEQYISKEFPDGASVEAALLRAKAGGAIDITLAKKVNPWMNDNGVFLPGCLVDQRQGYVVPPGTTFYGSAELTNALGVTPDGLYQRVAEKNNTYAKYKGTDGVDYYCAASDCVRGYTGEGYGIDRWTCRVAETLLITDEGIKIPVSSSAGALSQYLSTADYQDVLNLLKGKTVTLSALFADGELIVNTVTLPESISANTNFGTVEKSDGSCSIYLRWYTNGRLIFDVYSFADRTKDYTLKAIKLELGTEQTLAHQDANGNWQLNEIPDYGEQLARCQRYRRPLNGVWWLHPDKDGISRVAIPLNPPMRTVPAVTFSAADGSTGTIHMDENIRTTDMVQFYATDVTGMCGVKDVVCICEL